MKHSYISAFGLFLGLILTAGSDGHTSHDVIGRQRSLLKQEVSREREVANRLLNRLMDVAFETFKEMGGSTVELQEIQKKRSYIQACYFQAIACY